jgi:hypothetical protein
MQFCEECGSLLPVDEATGECKQCGTAFEQSTPDRPASDGGSERSAPSTDLERLPTTASGSVKKADAIEWLAARDRPSGADLRRATVEKPSDFSGSTFPTDISTIRLTGGPEFIETVAGLFAWIVDMEDYSRRVEINLKETEDRETGDETGNYALYLSVAERG